jgi:hypothetical protein
MNSFEHNPFASDAPLFEDHENPSPEMRAAEAAAMGRDQIGFYSMIERLGGKAPETQVESVTESFARNLAQLSTATLLEFRAHCLTTGRGRPEDNTVVLIIDGQLALRELADS